MSRRVFDVLVPFAYVLLLLVAVSIGNQEWVGITALIGAILVAAYYIALRPSVKKADSYNPSS